MRARSRPGTEVFLNQLAGPHRDRVVMTPAYNVVAVAVEGVSETVGESLAVSVSVAGG